MNNNNYSSMYKKIFKILGNYTPLKADCGELCGKACCKGDSNTGMLLFPFEENTLDVKILSSGDRLAVCTGSCDRDKRPLACRIFPFFPTIDDKGKIYVEIDYRAYRLCPMVEHADEILFDRKFLRAVKKAGKILSKDKSCREFLYKTTKEIDTYAAFLLNE